LVTLPRAILFDLDDTLLDDSGGVTELWCEVTFSVVTETGSGRAQELLDEIERIRTRFWNDPERHRDGRQDLRAATRGIVAEAAESVYGSPRPELAATIAERYRDRRDASIALLPGALQTLDQVRDRGLRTALITNGSAPAQRGKIERFNLAGYFDYILIEGEYGIGKPDPAVYTATLTSLRIPARDAWMVGDNLEWDVAAPQRLGILGIWIDGDGQGVPAESDIVPDRVLHSVSHLLDGVAEP
jgi:putative hydrolase of the HAD superfamily